MQPRRKVPMVGVGALVAVALVTAGAGCSSTPRSGGRVRVVAAENFWGDIANQIGGGQVSVRSLIRDPETDPHQFESNARDAAAVADADVVVVNGASYDDFVSKLLSSTSHKGRTVLRVADLLHAPADANPHLWYDLPRIPDVARAIAGALEAAAPAERDRFAANLSTFLASLAPLDRVVAQIAAKHRGAPVAYTERVPGYLLIAAGLTIATPPGFAQAVEDGNEPSAAAAQRMDELVAGRRVRALLYNSQATSAVTKHVEEGARNAGIPVVAVTETMPRDEPTFQAWQLGQLQALQRALGG